MTIPSLYITHATGSLRQRGLEFVQQQYRLSFGTTPTDEPDYLFVACTDVGANASEIIGTIGISLWKSNQPMRLARVYDFDEKIDPRLPSPESTFEYGRLVATRGGISKALIASASQFALSVGRTCGWCEHTDAVHRICMSFGLSFALIPATLRPDAIADGDKEFYRRNPSARLYATNTREWIKTLADSVTYKHGVWSIH